MTRRGSRAAALGCLLATVLTACDTGSASTPHTLRSSVALPSIPDEGLLMDQGGVATFRSLDGRTVVPLAGFSVSGGAIVGSAVWLRDSDGVTWRFEPAAHRLVRSSVAYDTGEGLRALGNLGKPAGERVGHWRLAFPGPRGQLLAQWSGECEVPTVYVISASHQLRLIAKDRTVEALARGWTRAGRPLVELLAGACGSGAGTPGLFQEDPPGTLRLLVAGTDIAYYATTPS